MILVPLFDLKFLNEFAAGGAGNFKSAALGVPKQAPVAGSLQTVGLRAHSHWKVCSATAMTRFLVCGRFDSA
jgi:hypothetical protein